ncbi:MAG TPA: PfkB family carbohydrate kinase [Actinomycetota bacterium]|nr:PfkB family carbohydrate kinase [Actinomycetota bacterium]
MRVAVVGHVEWITFARVDRVPRAGAIAHASATWAGAGGGGAVAAVQLAKLAGSCGLLTALGDDDVGRRAREELGSSGVLVHAATRDGPTRQGICLVDDDGERTITTLGPRLEARGADPLPWGRLDDADAVYVTAGDEEAVRRARAARVLVVSTRHLSTLAASGVRADVVVGSDRDPHERYDPAALAHAPPGLVVMTRGGDGGRFETDAGDAGRWDATPLPGPVVDTYGSGDSFQAGLTFAFGAGMELGAALTLAARCGAAALTGRGPADGQLTAADL